MSSLYCAVILFHTTPALFCCFVLPQQIWVYGFADPNKKVGQNWLLEAETVRCGGVDKNGGQ